jgi:Uma2 family endonuclease
MAAAHPLFTSIEDYLALEEKNQIKHEYVAGKVVALAGASPNHNLIVGSTLIELGVQLRGRGCFLYPSDQKVKTPSGLIAYPDIALTCGKPHYDQQHTDILLNPNVIIEVLSPSTEKYDRGVKFTHYRSLVSLQEYVLIAQDAYHVARYTRQPDGEWSFLDAIGRETELILRSLGISLKLAMVYEKVDLEE